MNRETQYREELETSRKRRRGRLVLAAVLSVLVLALLSGAAWYLLSGRAGEQRYADYLDEGNRYLIAMDYESAEFVFLKAIEEAPEQPEAYEKLANVYITLGRYEDAQLLLERGIRSTGSDVLAKTYERVSSLLQNNFASITADTMSLDDLLRVSEGLTLDASLYDVIASYTYQDYVAAYGEPLTAQSNSYGGQDVTFAGFPGTVSFRSAEYQNSRADAVTFGNLSDLLGNYQGAASAEKLEELYGSEMRITVSETSGQHFVSFTYHGCVVSIVSDENGNVYGNASNVVYPDGSAASEEEEEQQETEEDQGRRLAAGHVINAVNGGSVRATLKFLNGGRYGSVVLETSAQRDGSFEARLDPGRYTVEIRATGFITSYEELIINNNQDVRGLNYALSPELEAGEVRIILTWGSYPRDLDSHLTGTDSQGRSIHISYTNFAEDGVASLDLDDVSGFGPETTTIYDTGGSYTFSVHNFSDGNDSTALAGSGAQVKVYLSGSAEPVVYEISGGEGTWWDVCRIENGEVTPLGDVR